MKLYLDVCCLNRPFDDQSQNRVRLEAEAILSILEMAQSDKLEIISSDVIDDERFLAVFSGIEMARSSMRCKAPCFNPEEIESFSPGLARFREGYPGCRH